MAVRESNDRRDWKPTTVDVRVIVDSLRGAVGSLDLLDPDVRAAWADRFRARGVSYLILDCFRPVLDALGLDEHHDAGRLLVAIDTLMTEAGISEACIVHHMGHLNERSRGDSRLRDWPDVEWRLVRQDDDPASPRFITAYGRDVDVPESELVYDRSSRRLTVRDGSRHDSHIRAALMDISAVLREQSPLSGRAIKTALVESEHARDAIEQGLRFGCRTGALSAEDGPRNSRLYRLSVSVSGSVPSVSPDTASECPAAYTERDTRTHSDSSECPDKSGDQIDPGEADVELF
jgi:hypothetical protein